eukprot:7622936-Pyramimonas_sp.AAC.1
MNKLPHRETLTVFDCPVGRCIRRSGQWICRPSFAPFGGFTNGGGGFTSRGGGFTSGGGGFAGLPSPLAKSKWLATAPSLA